jgi:hypothetical protein
MGIFPNFFFEKMQPSIQKLLNRSTPTAIVQEQEQPSSAVAATEVVPQFFTEPQGN